MATGLTPPGFNNDHGEFGHGVSGESIGLLEKR